jgi:hypothetical protein
MICSTLLSWNYLACKKGNALGVTSHNKNLESKGGRVLSHGSNPSVF